MSVAMNGIGLTDAQIAAVRRPLSEAALLPARVYSDPGIFQLERERIFARSWLPVCHISQIPEPGRYVARNLVGEAVLAVRDRDGQVRVLSNVCRHRNTVLATGSGTCKGNRIMCPYHGWVYNLDGRLIGAPFMEQATRFEKRDIRLPEFRSETWHGFVFVNFDALAPSLTPQLAGLEATIAPYRFEDMEAVELRRTRVSWNWKLSLENFSEAYHQPWIHPATADHAFPATLAEYQDVAGPYGLFSLFQKDGGIVQSLLPGVTGLPDRLQRSVTVYDVYPYMHSLTDPAIPLVLDFNIRNQDDHEMVWSVLLPKGSHENPVEVGKLLGQYKEFIEPIMLEDVDVCSRVGQGVHSRFTTQGRLSHMEKTIHQFHNWWLDQMLADQTGPTLRA